MTAYRCWLENPSDKPLARKIAEGWYGEAPAGDFPHHQGHSWPITLEQWCRLRSLKPVRDGLILSVRVKQADVMAYLEHVYGDDPSYTDPGRMLTWKGNAYLANRLTNLRAFVAQALNPRLWYILKADEF